MEARYIICDTCTETKQIFPIRFNVGSDSKWLKLGNTKDFCSIDCMIKYLEKEKNKYELTES